MSRYGRHERPYELGSEVVLNNSGAIFRIIAQHDNQGRMPLMYLLEDTRTREEAGWFEHREVMPNRLLSYDSSERDSHLPSFRSSENEYGNRRLPDYSRYDDERDMMEAERRARETEENPEEYYPGDIRGEGYSRDGRSHGHHGDGPLRRGELPLFDDPRQGSYGRHNGGGGHRGHGSHHDRGFRRSVGHAVSRGWGAFSSPGSTRSRW